MLRSRELDLGNTPDQDVAKQNDEAQGPRDRATLGERADMREQVIMKG